MNCKYKDKLIGQTINGYQVVEKLGEGNYGTVFYARHAIEGLVAVKIEFYEKRSQKKRQPFLLQRERTFYQQYLSDCKYTPKLYSAYPFDKHPYMLAIELFGHDIRVVFESCFSYKFSEECLDKMLALMLEILDNVHSLGIIHRDIKPENFMVAAKKTQFPIVIADFGLAIP